MDVRLLCKKVCIFLCCIFLRYVFLRCTLFICVSTIDKVVKQFSKCLVPINGLSYVSKSRVKSQKVSHPKSCWAALLRRTMTLNFRLMKCIEVKYECWRWEFQVEYFPREKSEHPQAMGTPPQHAQSQIQTMHNHEYRQMSVGVLGWPMDIQGVFFSLVPPLVRCI